MRYNEILSTDLRARGLWIEEDDHFIYLRHTNEVIARWSATSARLSSIRNAARTWVKDSSEGRKFMVKQGFIAKEMNNVSRC